MAHTPVVPLAPAGRLRTEAGRAERDSPRVVLDDVSKQIVEHLQQDGAMQIVAVTDPMSLGFRRQTMIGVRCSGDLERVADHLAGMEEIDYVVITAGSFDLLIEVVCEDDDQLLEILSRVRSFPSVTTTETFVYLKLRKQTYSWGTR